MGRQWRKKTKHQRSEILTKACSEPCLSNQPIFREKLSAWIGSARHGSIQSDIGRLLPYLDVESLNQDASRLLKLIFARCNRRHTAFFDWDALQLIPAWLSGETIDVYFQNNIQVRGGEFGKIVSLNLDLIHLGEHYSGSLAMATLTPNGSSTRIWSLQ